MSVAVAAPLHEAGGNFTAGKSGAKSKRLINGKNRKQIVTAPREAGQKDKAAPAKRAPRGARAARPQKAAAQGFYYLGNVQKPRPYEKAIHHMARKYHVPEDLIHAVVQTESGYNYRTRGGVGEIGLMQLRPATARLLGYKGSVRGLYNPAINLEYGTRYLALAQNLSGGNLCGTVLKYNAGHGAQRMNPVSFRYCQRVKAYLSAVGYR
ncbi:lytic transglycosylase domain-containing protein [Candidatus Tokpelaia sp.]|nr:lytic transglycosylase domain-containing protein [Candidatus Tokpelaia sp.]